MQVDLLAGGPCGELHVRLLGPGVTVIETNGFLWHLNSTI